MDNLLDENADTRVQASNELVKIIESVPAKQQKEIIKYYQDNLIGG